MNYSLQKRCFLVAFLISGLIASCGKDFDPKLLSTEVKQMNFQQFISQGRRIAVGSADQNSGALGLAQSDRIVRLDRDNQSGNPTWIVFDVEQMPSVQKNDLVNSTQDFIEQNQDLVPVKIQDLISPTKQTLQISSNYISVFFQRKHEGLEVRDSLVEFIFAKQNDESYRLREIVERHIGGQLPDNNAASVSSDDALLLIGADIKSFQGIGDRQLILPVEVSPGRYEYKKITEHKFKSLETGMDVTVSIENSTQKILEAFSNHVFAQSIAAQAYQRNYMDPTKTAFSIPFVSIESGTSTVKADGLGVLSSPVSGPVKLILESQREVIVDGGQKTSLDLNLSESNAPVAFKNNDLNAVNAYIAVQRVNGFVRKHLLTSEVPYLDMKLKVNINVSGSCNSYYTGATVNLFSAGSGCANMATVNDVIFHEWGHGLDDYTGRQQGITDGAFSEAIGDILSAYNVGDSSMAPGFKSNSKRGIREINNQNSYPKDRGEIHFEGLIVGGAFWDLRTMLVQRYGAIKGAYKAEELFLRHLLNTDSYLESYQNVLRLDSENGSSTKKSPNYCLITEAFAKHGLAKSEAGCVDNVEQNKDPIPVDNTISLAVQENKDGSVMFVAASKNVDARSVDICLVGHEACKTGQKTDQTLDLEGQKDGLLFFTSSNSIALKEGQEIYLVVRNQAKQAVGARTIKAMLR